MFTLESPLRGDSNEYTRYSIINKKRKSPYIITNIIMSAAIGVFLGTQERVRNSHGKRAIGVRAIEVLLKMGTITGKTTELNSICFSSQE